jgi:CubicO group peptidase (beta-lactamase class C family)
MVTRLRQEDLAALDVPGCAAACFDDGGTGETTVTGQRATHGAAAVSEGDRWHFGSCGKAMTSAMIARLADDGVLDWSAPLASEVTEAGGTPHAEVTLADLLAHRSGLPTNPAAWRLLRYMAFGGNAQHASNAMTDALLRKRPLFNAGSDFLYSNAGYGLAGLMAERATGTPFNALIRRHVLEPAGMSETQFGVPLQDGSAPLEHRPAIIGGGWKTVRQGARAVDDLGLFKPSGCLSGPVADLARFGRWHVNESRRGAMARTISPSGPPPQQGQGWRYGFGWMLDDDRDLGPFYWHSGSTGGTFAFIAVFPEPSLGFAFAANAFRADWAKPGSAFTNALIAAFKAAIRRPAI